MGCSGSESFGRMPTTESWAMYLPKSYDGWIGRWKQTWVFAKIIDFFHDNDYFTTNSSMIRSESLSLTLCSLHEAAQILLCWCM